MKNITIENEAGDIVAKLYVKDNGNLHVDSWICNEGWKCIEGDCSSCHLIEVCEQNGPTRGFTRWLDD